MVDFLEGDPDRPLITGGVYNGDNRPPYPLPDNATVTGLKSRSTKAGRGYNEIRLEDKKGSEQLVIRAERDQEIQVKHDAFETIGNESGRIRPSRSAGTDIPTSRTIGKRRSVARLPCRPKTSSSRPEEASP